MTAGSVRWWLPSLADFLYIAILLWMITFTVVDTGTGLIQDAGTGYHIRVGEWVLDHHAVPHQDILSFTRAGKPWFAWEWLASTGFAAIYRLAGMKGVIVGSAFVIAWSVLLILRHMAWRGANALVVLLLIHFGIGASSIHYLARPHIFTLLFMAVSLWLLDADRNRNTAAIWLIVPLTALWANMHGGFAGILASTALIAFGSIIQAWMDRANRGIHRKSAIRYASLSAGCLLASVLNPYGFEEHKHIFDYMNQKWLVEIVEEFQSPNFHAIQGLYFEVLLLTGVFVAIRLLARKEIASALLILAWGHLSLVSVRHVPIFVIVLLPFAASELSSLWRACIVTLPPRSIPGTLDKIGSDHAPSLQRNTIFALLVTVLLASFSFGLPYPVDFPQPRYPVSLINRHAGLIAGAHVFTTDSWGDYLTFRFYPQQRIFIDGRSDFFGERFSGEYTATLYGHRGWEKVLRENGVDVVMVPADAGLASLLRDRPDWTAVEDAAGVALFRINGKF